MAYEKRTLVDDETIIDKDLLDHIQEGIVAAHDDNASAQASIATAQEEVDNLTGALKNEHNEINVASDFEFSDRSGQNRLFYYVYQDDGDYIANAESPLWVSIQGWDTETFDGTNVSNTGKIYTFPHKFTIDSKSTGLFYRVVFGVDSGTISDAQKENAKLSKVVSYQNAVLSETKIKNNTFVNTNLMAIAHGNTPSHPANNLEMFRMMYRKGIKYWECDIRKCADGYVLCHDDDICNLAITAEGDVIEEGTVLISQSTVAQLQTYKFGILRGQQANGLVAGYENTTIPTLQEFTLLAKALGCIPVYEIKFNATAEEITEICNIIKSLGMFDQSYFMAYAWAQRIAPYLCDNGVKNIVLSVSGTDQVAAIETAYSYIESYVDQLDNIVYDIDDGNYKVFNSTIAAKAAEKGMRVIIYGVYDTTKTTQILSAFKLGCSGFITNGHNPIPIIQNYYHA